MKNVFFIQVRVAKVELKDLTHNSDLTLQNFFPREIAWRLTHNIVIQNIMEPIHHEKASVCVVKFTWRKRSRHIVSDKCHGNDKTEKLLSLDKTIDSTHRRYKDSVLKISYDGDEH